MEELFVRGACYEIRHIRDQALESQMDEAVEQT